MEGVEWKGWSGRGGVEGVEWKGGVEGVEWMWPCYLYGQGKYNTSDMYVEVCVACKGQIAGIVTDINSYLLISRFHNTCLISSVCLLLKGCLRVWLGLIDCIQHFHTAKWSMESCMTTSASGWLSEVA